MRAVVAHLSSRHPEFSAGAAGVILQAQAHRSWDCAACWAARGRLACKAHSHLELRGDPAGARSPWPGCSKCVKTGAARNWSNRTWEAEGPSSPERPPHPQQHSHPMHLRPSSAATSLSKHIRGRLSCSRPGSNTHPRRKFPDRVLLPPPRSLLSASAPWSRRSSLPLWRL